MKPACLAASLLLAFFSDAGFCGGLSKQEALSLMKKNGYRWKQTELLKSEADAKENEALSAFRPHVSFALREYAARINQLQFGFDTPGPLSIFVGGTAGFLATCSIFDKTAIDRLDAAHANENIAAATSAQYKSDLTYLMLAQYLNVQRLKKRLDSIDANIARNVEILKAVTAKFDSGFGIALDVMRARGLVEAEKLKQADAKYAYLKARQELANTIGEEELQGELEPLAFRELPASARSPEPEDGMERRPDLIAARQTVLAAGYLKRAAHDEWLPKISILADLGVLGTGYSIFGLGSFNNGVNGSAGVQVSIPVYTGGYHAAKEQEAGVKLLKVELDEQQLKLEAQSQIRLAEAQLTQANTAVNASNERIHIAEEELKLARQRSQTGSASGLELANSQANMAAAADMNVDAVFAYELSKVNYFKSMGRLSAYFETGVQ